MKYNFFSIDNGLQIIHLASDSPVAYCGFAINAGTRDETVDQHGLAHFIEHLLFKGTKKRKAWHILNRMENVGGELNAYTTKEETFIYSICLAEDTERAVELLSDIVFNSSFPEHELEKEREVILDEINSYKDNPSELIFDEFENLLFNGSDIGHFILGDEKSLQTFNSQSCYEFTNRFYVPENMIFFYHGKIPLSKMRRLSDKYFSVEKSSPFQKNDRKAPRKNPSVKEEYNKDLHQSHVILGGVGYDVFHKNRMGLFLLNNLLGGPGMNSRLNIALRERNGLVYTVESGLTTYSDVGVFSIYFGCDNKSKEKCLKLIHKELKNLRNNSLTTSQLSAAVKQLKGQLGISSDNRENQALRMGKSFLHLKKCATLPEIYHAIDAVTNSQLLAIANEIFDENRLFQIIYT